MSNYIDTSSAIQVLGCIFAKPTLLQDDKHSFHEDDFPQDLHRIIFAAMNNLYTSGGNTSFSIQTIDNYLSTKPKSYAIFKNQNGREWLQNAYEHADIVNYPYYADRVKKMTLLRSYEKAGVDVRFIYDPDTLDPKEKQEQESRFDKLDVNEMAELVEDKISRVKQLVVDDANSFDFHAGDNSDDYLEAIINGDHDGYPLYDTVFNRVVMGARPGKCYLRSASSGTGKALPNSEIVLTPDGWKTVGSIKEGDYLYSRLGQKTKVLKVYPQGKRKVWKITLNDGREARCDGEHLWTVYDAAHVQYTLETQELVGGKYNLPRNESLNFDRKPILGSCYLIGYKLRTEGKEGEQIKDCLFGDQEQRTEFFLGLMNAENLLPYMKSFFRTEHLANIAAAAARSLGFYAWVRGNKISVITYKEQPLILDVEETDETEEMTCFLVGNREHLFIMRDFIVTHNTRTAIADACSLACDEIYENGEWQDAGSRIPTLYISVEQDPQEIESLIWSFISCVPSDHIDMNEFEVGEFDRVKKAIEIEKRSKLFCEFMPDYKLKDVRNAILRGIRDHGVRVVFFDYICSSISIMNEITQAAGGTKISEYQILYLMASALKDIAENFGITIITSSQLNGTARQDKTPDANVLSGAKSMANRMDVCCAMMDVSSEDLEDIDGFFSVDPNVKLCLFKNRAGRWNRVILWMWADKGTCRYRTIGATDYKFNLIPLEEILPTIRESAF